MYLGGYFWFAGFKKIIELSLVASLIVYLGYGLQDQNYSFLESLLPRNAVLRLGKISFEIFVMSALITILSSMSGRYMGAKAFVLEGAMVTSFKLKAQMARGMELSEGVVQTH